MGIVPFWKLLHSIEALCILTDIFCSGFWASLGGYFSLLGSLGSCVVVGVLSVSATPHMVKAVTFSPLFPGDSGPGWPLAPSLRMCSKHAQCLLSLGLSSLVGLFLGLWRPRRPGIQPVSNFPQGPQIISKYVLSKICCFLILAHCINYLLLHYNITTNLTA